MLRFIFTAVLYLISVLGLMGQFSINQFGANEEGYVFISDVNTNSYLFNKCGEQVRTWDHENFAGLVGVFTHDNKVLRTGKVPSCCIQASDGGLIELVSLDGEVEWSYNFATDSATQHHDLFYMENGNILFLGWEVLEDESLVALGKENVESDLWGEYVWEVKPLGRDSFELVWEWHLSDHTVQDVNADAANFGVIADNPRKVDINYFGPHAWSERDWWHANAIGYNPERDEIVINCRANGEMWIIDHSTTTDEASASSGGNGGVGGDLLFRWGNPVAYGQGTIDDLALFGSHGTDWIASGLPDEGKILFFNNGVSRPNVSSTRSTVEMIEPMLDSEGKYVMSDSVFMIQNHEVIYGDTDQEVFDSAFMSNAQQLPGGGFLINASYLGSGNVFEIDADRTRVWEIRNLRGFKAFFIEPNAELNALVPESSGSDRVGFSNVNLCAGPVRLSALSVNDNVVWSDGQSGKDIIVTSAGEYSFTSSGDCGDRQSDRLTVMAEELPRAVIGTTIPFLCDPSLFCHDRTRLWVSPDYERVVWSTGDTTYAIVPEGPGTYTAMTSDHCMDSFQMSANTVRLGPISPVADRVVEVQRGGDITIDVNDTVFDVLWFENDTIDQWFFEGRSLEFLNVQEDTVVYVAASPCSSCYSERAAVTIEVLSTGTDEILPGSIILHPNPVVDILNLRTEQNWSELTMLDGTGKIMQELDPATQVLDLSSYAPGLYYLRAIGAEGRVQLEQVVKL